MLKHKNYLAISILAAVLAGVGALLGSSSAGALNIDYEERGDNIVIKTSALGSDYTFSSTFNEVTLVPSRNNAGVYESEFGEISWNYKGAAHSCTGVLVVNTRGSANNLVGTLTAKYDLSNQDSLSSQEGDECVEGIPMDAGTASPEDLTDPSVNTGMVQGDESEEELEETTCVVDGIGWLVCAAAMAGAKAMDGIYSLLETMLVVPRLNIDTADGTNGTYIAWKIARNIANMAFILAFLVIIASHVTSIGVSNYGIKKMLPRLIISAILVNISYWLAAGAVDISNIFGNSIYDLLQGIRNNIGGISLDGNHWEVLIASLLAGGSIAIVASGALALVPATGGAAVATAALWVALPMLLGALLAVLVAVLVVAARHALIVILIVIAPLAFVAFLLPNTEKLFSMWRKSFVAMLAFYPLVSLVFAASQLSSLLILQSLKGNEGMVAHMIILALFVQVAPLVLTPKLVAVGSGFIGRIAGVVNNKNRGLIDRAKNRRKDKVDIAKKAFVNAPANRQKRGLFRGRRTAGGVVQSLARRMSYGKRTDDATARALENQAVEQWGNYVQTGNIESPGALSPREYIDQRLASSTEGIVRKLKAEEVDIEVGRLKDTVFEGDARESMRALSLGGKTKIIDESGQTIEVDAQNNAALHKAAIKMVFDSGDAEGINQVIDANAGKLFSREVQQSLADTATSSSNRPAYLGFGEIDNIRQGKGRASREVMKAALKSGAYSSEDIANAPVDDLEAIHKFITNNPDMATDPELKAAVDLFRYRAREATMDVNLKVKLKKNTQVVKNIAAGKPWQSPPNPTPAPPPAQTPPPTPTTPAPGPGPGGPQTP